MRMKEQCLIQDTTVVLKGTSYVLEAIVILSKVESEEFPKEVLMFNKAVSILGSADGQRALGISMMCLGIVT